MCYSRDVHILEAFISVSSRIAGSAVKSANPSCTTDLRFILLFFFQHEPDTRTASINRERISGATARIKRLFH